MPKRILMRIISKSKNSRTPQAARNLSNLSIIVNINRRLFPIIIDEHFFDY